MTSGPLSPRSASRGPEFRFGEGKISGVLAVFCGWLGLGAVVALHFPEYFSTPDLRAGYPMPFIRRLIDGVIIGALVSGVVSLVLDRRRSRGLLALGLAAAALALGGGRVPIEGPITRAPYVGLDWFLLKILGLSLVFIPLERLFARLEQRVFRGGWRTDLAHFGASHLFIQATVLATMVPAAVFFHWAVNDSVQTWVSSQPIWLQFVEALVLADLFAYGAHRLFHEVPWLWRFHAIHHSSEHLDWLAGSRLHIVDIIVTRAVGFLPLYILGFSEAALYAYLTWASFQAVFIHANVRFTFGPLRYLLATPQFHHWHHSATRHNQNYAVHLPFIDRIFGTYYLPGNDWPDTYGLTGRPVPDGYLRQLVQPFLGRRRPTTGPG